MGTLQANPRYYKGPLLLQDKITGQDSSTWTAGAPGRFDTTGEAHACATDTQDVKFIFAAAKASADTSGTNDTESVLRIPSAATKFVGYVVATGDLTGAATAATKANVGISYGIYVNAAGIAAINLSEVSNVAVQTDAVWWEKEAYKNASGDYPGQMVFHYLQSVLDG